MNTLLWGPLLLRILALGIPLILALAAAGTPRRSPFRWALPAAACAGLLALGVGMGAAWLSPASQPPTHLDPWAAACLRFVRLDLVALLMLGLVCILGWVIVRFSRTYLSGEQGQRRYVRALLATLSMVTLLVLSNHLVVLGVAWMGTSFALHHLLTFYADRPQAQIVAHKKFLLSRLADVCLWVAILLLGGEMGTLYLDRMGAWAQAQAELPASVQVATVLLVVTVTLKSAQIPFHGWLIQVMEAPTPVSALLHAGVVNIGGFVLISLAPLMAQAPWALGWLLLVGTVTAVLAALIMTTRVSIKVALAWSTCAQMGFMLVQCGLGAWHLALLHLLAHSFYKAHAFLHSGSTVETWRIQAMAPLRPPLRAQHFWIGGLVGGLLVGGAYAATGWLERGEHGDPSLGLWALLLAMALLPLLARGVGSGVQALAGVMVYASGVVLLYFAWHALFGSLVPGAQIAPAWAWAWVLTAFGTLLGLQWALQARPHGPFAKRFQPHLFAGLYLDEFFTRLTFRVWPPRAQTTLPAYRPSHPMENPQVGS
ncbi:MAG: NADH-quinone oxidoreductase subunit L [Planctomycetes bacterium]|nr:NADH-quinone oxidoreductase subunit L [Planctomycetota bacterium]HRV79865.1 NADH-quinone oxidoreductase subunit L [Planctomycetota bacterium]